MRLYGLVDSSVDRNDRPMMFGEIFDAEWETDIGGGIGPVDSVMPYISATAGTPHLSLYNLDIQLRSGQESVPESTRRVIEIWFSDSWLGPPSSTAVTRYFTGTAGVDMIRGKIITEIIPGIHYRLLSTARGRVTAQFMIHRLAYCAVVDRGRVYYSTEMRIIP